MEIIAQEHETFVLIERKDNGWVITMSGEAEYPLLRSEVYEDVDETHLDHMKSLQLLLLNVKEALGEYNNKHEEHRLEIHVINQEGKEVEE
jgi:hypothetical protein